jgi:hypothetical protein
LERSLLGAWIGFGEFIPGLVSEKEYRRYLDGHYLQGLRVGLDNTGVT